MINWINFLHIYQPPRQNENVFHQVARESYFEIAKFFDAYDGMKLTMNISGSLLEQFIGYRYDKLLEDFVKAFANGEMELVGSAMYHPILPLLPDEEIKRQIVLDENMKRKVFGNGYRRRGFYLPEMGYGQKISNLLESMGFEWIILDEISYGGKLNGFDKEKVYKIKDTNLKVIFRDRDISNHFVPEEIKKISDVARDKNFNIITATDGELYGHHHQDFYNKTKEAFSDKNIKSYKVSEFIDEFGKGNLEEISPVASSWESTEEDLAANIPYAYWNNPENAIQASLWDFANFAMKTVEDHNEDGNYKVARTFLDQGLSSCHFWAASGKRSSVWKDLIWNPDVIENGNLLFIKAIRSIYKLDTENRMEAERKFLQITKLIWHMHWNKFYHF